MKKRILSALLVVALFLTAFANVSAADRNSLDNFQKQASYTAGQFADVAPGAWYEDNVKSAYELGLMVGTSGTAFDPEGQLSIAQAVTIAARLHNVYAGNGEAFAPGTPWYQVYMDYAAIHGMLVPADYPDPEALATRAEYAAILSAAFPDEALTPLNTVNAIPDVPADADYAPAVLRLYRAGILKGNDASGTFAPDRGINRAEVAAMVTRMADPALRLRFTLPEQETGDTVTVTFDWNYGGKTPQTVEVPIGQPVPEPEQPTRTLFRFDGWFNPMNGFVKYDFSAPVYEDITLYAHWSTVVKHEGKEPEPLPSPEPSEEPGFYTVTFDSNGGSAVAAQTVAKGATATKPADPTRDGFTFVGWYSNSELTTLFDFAIEVNANLIVYARWDWIDTEDHTFLDDPDPDVEIYSFKADIWDILVGTTETVTFTSEIFSNIALEDSDVSVVDNDGTVLGIMNDLGVNGDAIADDGIYTLQISMSSDSIQVVAYHVAVKDVISDDFLVNYYREYTDQDFDIVDDVQRGLETAIQPYLNADGTVAPSNVDAAVETMVAYLDTLISNGMIASYQVNNACVSVVTSTGYPFEFCLEIEGYESGGTDVFVVSYQPYFGTRGSMNELYNEALDGTASNIDSTFDWYHFNENGNYDLDEVTLDALKSLPNFGVIIWGGHGGYDNSENGTGSCLCTGEIVNRNTAKKYSAAISAGRVIDTLSAGNRRTYAVTGGFFSIDVQGDMTGAFVYLSACHSGQDMLDGINHRYQLVQAFLDKGATAVIANSESILSVYTYEMERDVINTMCTLSPDTNNYYTASEALETVMGTTRRDDGTNLHAHPVLFPQNDQAATNYRFADNETGFLSGSIKSTEDSRPVQNALVRIYDTSGNMLKTIRSDANGFYQIQLSTGDYVIKVTANGFKSVKMAATVVTDQTAYVETILLVDHLLTLGYANGRIINASVAGQGISDVTIRLRSGGNNRTGVVLYTTATNENGYYEIANIIPGWYTMEYSKTGFVTGYKNIIVGVINFMSQNAFMEPLSSEGVYVITLSWVDHPSDLDAHLAGPTSTGGRFHLYYPQADSNGGSPEPDYYGLDVDNTRIREKPDENEHIYIKQQQEGPYVYSVHDFSNGGDGSSTSMASSRAVVTISRGNTIVATFHVPSTAVGTIWTVFELNGDTITPINRIGNGQSGDIELFDPYFTSNGGDGE